MIKLNSLFSRFIVVVSALLIVLSLTGCLGYPKVIEPVTGFDQSRYLGRWYEIARLDHSFERGLQGVTADYSLRDDGGIRVINRGFNAKENQWQQAEGRAYFVRDETEAYLKVSFFGPFFGSYVVFDLGEDYNHSFIVGASNSYLWLLAREPRVTDALKKQFIESAKTLGVKEDEIIWVDQSVNISK